LALTIANSMRWATDPDRRLSAFPSSRPIVPLGVNNRQVDALGDRSIK